MLYGATRVTYMDMRSSAHAATQGAYQCDEWFQVDECATHLH
jgi:hypothetical protein